MIKIIVPFLCVLALNVALATELVINYKADTLGLENFVIMNSYNLDTLYHGKLEIGSKITVKIDENIDLIAVNRFRTDNSRSTSQIYELDTNFMKIVVINNNLNIVENTLYQKDLKKFLDEFDEDLITYKNGQLPDDKMNQLKIDMMLAIKELITKYPNNILPFMASMSAMKLLNAEFINFVINKIEDNEKLNQNPIIKMLLSALSSINTISVGKAINDFELEDSNGTKRKILSFEKEFILIDFWASWCGPCLKQIPAIKQLQNNNLEKLQVVALSVDTERNDWKRKLNAFDKNIVHLIDQREINIQHKFGVTAIPFNILLHKTGEILMINAEIDEIQKYLNK